jgi:hypothetical protein
MPTVLARALRTSDLGVEVVGRLVDATPVYTVRSVELAVELSQALVVKAPNDLVRGIALRVGGRRPPHRARRRP